MNIVDFLLLLSRWNVDKTGFCSSSWPCCISILSFVFYLFVCFTCILREKKSEAKFSWCKLPRILNTIIVMPDKTSSWTMFYITVYDYVSCGTQFCFRKQIWLCFSWMFLLLLQNSTVSDINLLSRYCKEIIQYCFKQKKLNI